MMDKIRTEEKEKGFHRKSRMDRHSRWFLHARILLLAVMAFPVMNVGVTLADDQSLPLITVGYQQGTITAIYEKTFDIDRRTYRLTPDAVLRDEAGNLMEPDSLVVTAEVKFHVKKEESDKIDRMIVTLPR